MQRLQDRIAVITGAGSGIGLASTRRLAAEGALVVAVDVDEAAGKRAADEADGLFVHADVTEPDAVREMYQQVVDAYGAVHIAFNNAGISPPDDDSILTTGLYAWRRAALARFVGLPPSPLERREKLEQLRALEAGMRIDIELVDTAPLGVDTPDDLERAREMLAPGRKHV